MATDPMSVSEPTAGPRRHGVYESKPCYRWLALVAALLAWGFDGVEQGVYAIMTMGTVYLLGLVVIAFAPDTGGRMKEEGAGA